EDQVVLRAEVPVEGPGRQPGLPQDVDDRRRPGRRGADDAEGGPQDRLLLRPVVAHARRLGRTAGYRKRRFHMYVPAKSSIQPSVSGGAVPLPSMAIQVTPASSSSAKASRWRPASSFGWAIDMSRYGMHTSRSAPRGPASSRSWRILAARSAV